MALRIRKTGEILCAAHTEVMEDDTYINDGIHYYLSQLTGAIRASPNHEVDNLWFWNIKDDMKKHYKDIRNHKRLKGMPRVFRSVRRCRITN
jgi:hypothetical protein